MAELKLSNLKEDNSIDSKVKGDEPERTVEYWEKQFTGIDKKIFEMVVFEKGYEKRDRLTKSQLDFLMTRRKNKKLG